VSGHKFQLGARVELTEEAKDMFPVLSRSHGIVTGRLPKSDTMPYRIKWDRRANIEPFAGDLLQEVNTAVTIPSAKYEALIAAAKAGTALERDVQKSANPNDWFKSMAEFFGKLAALRAAGIQIEGE